MKKDYMTRLERWANWMLPRQEAEDVIADYREIVGTPPRPQEQLLRDLGKPRSVIRPLAQPKQYRTWLAVFTVTALCVLALGISPTLPGYPLWRLLFDRWYDYGGYPVGALIAAALGASATLVWFRWKGSKMGNLPKAIPVLLAVFLIFIGVVLWFCWTCARDFDAFLEMWGTIRSFIGTDISRSFYLFRCAMGYGSTIISFLGVFGLVKARMGDRRWAAVYILAMVAILAALSVLHITGWMDVFRAPEEMFRIMLTQCAVITVLGLAGTGVSLC